MMSPGLRILGRPALAAKVRLQRDGASSRLWLVYPEHGLVLNETAARIVQLCDGTRSVEEITELLADHSDAPPERIEMDVCWFLAALAKRNLLAWSDS